MIQKRLIGTALAVVMAASLPAIVAAQDEAPTTPEGSTWTLVEYLGDETTGPTAVPFGVEATLLLQDGVASGSGGCNQFSGSYTIDGSSLSFDEEMTRTLALCEETVQAVEDAYLPLLGDVDTWAIEDEVLRLYDGIGDEILTFEVPGASLTTSQIVSLLSTLVELRVDVVTLTGDLDALRAETEALNVDRLRERIKTLESENNKLKKRVVAVEGGPKADPTSKPGGSSAFTSAEKVLLEGVPGQISNYCSPLRSSLPKGTRAAVSCKPKTSVVSSVDYYLMEGEDAARAYQSEMSTFNVPQPASSTKTCEQGVKSQRQWVGGGWVADGCYRASQRGELRYVDNATECRKLKVGNKTLQSPSMYIAVQGTDQDVERMYGWATKGLGDGGGQLTALTVPIKRPNAGWSPSCPR